jgi:hypothetical protein
MPFIYYLFPYLPFILISIIGGIFSFVTRRKVNELEDERIDILESIDELEEERDVIKIKLA